MITKTIGTILVVLVCVIVFPFAIAVLGGVFGIVAGVLGAVFGAIIGAIGAVFGAVFSVFDWAFDWRWPHHFFGCNVFTLALIVLIVALAARQRPIRK